jgi:ribosomal protein L11 methyltransferase
MGDLANETWWQLTVEVIQERSQQVEQALQQAGAAVVTIQDAGDQAILEPLPGETPVWSSSAVTGLFSSLTRLTQVKEKLSQTLDRDELADCHITQLENRDWERAWLDDFHPMRFGSRLWVCPTQQTPPDPSAVNLMLDPGLAFGTGTHPTTALCLTWLDSADLQGKQVIDYGCGSGILAIAAVKLGARQVWTVDVDPQALIATERNAADNKILASIFPVTPEQLPMVKVDILLANILAEPLLVLAAHFADLVREGGRVVLSGLLASQVAQIETVYKAWFDFKPPIYRQEWALCQAVRTSKKLPQKPTVA